ncbi:MAG: hypothetical protein LBK83_13680 [Treponema sp.]|jgi:hypothetical protein|nr:hypothetical protein [Treponema sp.]
MRIVIKSDAPVFGKAQVIHRATQAPGKKGVRVSIEAAQGFRKGIKFFTFLPDISLRKASSESAWVSVGDAFQSTGNSIRKAIYEQSAPARKKAK